MTNINVLIATFPTLDLPPTLSLVLPSNASVSSLHYAIQCRLPASTREFILTTTSSHRLPYSSDNLLSNYHNNNDFLPVRLSVPVLGGKGGFGSQLRAAGGRMSTKRKKNTGDENASSRNLDGRRLRTVNEAKALAEYLAIKPDMAKKEKEERRNRWEQVVEAAERREDDMKKGKGRLDGRWVEDKEEAGDRAREAVLTAMRRGWSDNLMEAKPNEDIRILGGSDEQDDLSGRRGNANDITTPLQRREKVEAHKFFDFDDDDEFMSSDNEDDQRTLDEAASSVEVANQIVEEVAQELAPNIRKGKSRAVR